MRRRCCPERALGTRAPMALPQAASQCRSLDFGSDALACGRRFRVPNVVDDSSREGLTSLVDASPSGRRVARKLPVIAAVRRPPLMVVSDNGTELKSHAVPGWCRKAGVEWYDIVPGKPAQSGLSKACMIACAASASMSTLSRCWGAARRTIERGGQTATTCGRAAALAACHPPSTSTVPVRGNHKPSLPRRRPENGEQVSKPPLCGHARATSL